MNWKDEWKWAALLLGGFLVVFYLPVGSARFDGAVLESFHLVKWYAREHVLLCLVPALFIAGAISVFVSQASVMKYLGASANKVLAYGVASVSGTVLAVCSCTVLPLFAGIYKRGAGLGPATAFLYSGPAINILAIVLTARVLGLEMGVARAVGAVGFSIVIGLLMHLIFIGEERERADEQRRVPVAEVPRHVSAQDAVYFASMVGILVFANWGAPQSATGFWQVVYAAKWLADRRRRGRFRRHSRCVVPAALVANRNRRRRDRRRSPRRSPRAAHPVRGGSARSVGRDRDRHG